MLSKLAYDDRLYLDPDSILSAPIRMLYHALQTPISLFTWADRLEKGDSIRECTMATLSQQSVIETSPMPKFIPGAACYKVL